MLSFCSKIFHHCNSHKGFAIYFSFYSFSKILLMFLSFYNLYFGRHKNFFPARNFAQVEFKGCVYDHIGNEISIIILGHIISC